MGPIKSINRSVLPGEEQEYYLFEKATLASEETLNRTGIIAKNHIQDIQPTFHCHKLNIDVLLIIGVNANGEIAILKGQVDMLMEFMRQTSTTELREATIQATRKEVLLVLPPLNLGYTSKFLGIRGDVFKSIRNHSPISKDIRATRR